MRFACADFTFPLLSHQQSLKLISMLGFDGVDLGLFENRSHLWPSTQFRDVSHQATELKKQLDDLELKAADVFLQVDADFNPVAINRPEPEVRAKARDWFEQTLEYAATLECEHVTALPGVEIEGEDRVTSLARTCEELEWRVEKSRAAGIVFGTEAHVGSIAQTPQAALELVQAVPGLTLTLDYTHFTRAGLPDSEVEPLIEVASHFHVRGARQGRLQCNFNQSTIDHGRVMEVMKATGYRGWTGIEYVWVDWEQCNESDNLSETIQYRDFLRERADALQL